MPKGGGRGAGLNAMSANQGDFGADNDCLAAAKDAGVKTPSTTLRGGGFKFVPAPFIQ